MHLDRRDYLLLGGIVAVIVFGFLAGPPERRAASVDANGTTTLDATTVRQVVGDIDRGRLSQVEREGLRAVRLEERLAHDVSMTLYETQQVRLLQDIGAAEGTHAAAAMVLLDRYGIDDPAPGERGAFAGERAAVYRNLAAVNGTDAALRAGAAVQERSIVELRAARRGSDNADIAFVHDLLLRGARNHIRALDRAMERRGVEYAPRHLNASAYRTIVESASERGS